MRKLGIALGGGGSRGFAHLGAIKAMEEQGLKFDAFAGTSAGAIVAALYAARKTPDEIMEIMKELPITRAAKFLLPKNGLASLDNLRKELDQVLEGREFADLEYPLYLAVSNLNTGEVEYIEKGNIALAVQASCSIPILFAPVEIAGQFYVDGGLMDNVPVAPLVDKVERIIAVDIMPLEVRESLEGLADIAVRTFQMSVSMQKSEKENTDRIIRLEGLSDYHILDTSENETIFEMGYDHVKEMDLSEFV